MYLRSSKRASRVLGCVVAGVCAIALAGCSWGGGTSASSSTGDLGMMTGSKAYMFGMSGAEIDSALRFYAGADVDKTTRARARWQLSQPFDPNKFGDLAFRVGPDNTRSLVHFAWKMAMSKASPETMEKRIESEIARMEKAWFKTSYSAGVPENSSFWTDSFAFEFDTDASNQVMTVALDFSPNDHANSETFGAYRIKQRSGVVDLGVYASSWAETRAFKQNKNGFWMPTKMTSLSVEGSAFAKTPDSILEFDFSNMKKGARFVTAYFAWDDMDNFYRAFASSSCGEAFMKGSKKFESVTVSACSDTR